MKPIIAAFLCLISVRSNAQTPYDNFAPEQSKKEMLSSPEIILRIYNPRANESISYIEFNSSEYSITYFDHSDKQTGKYMLDFTEFKWLSIDPKNKEYPNMSPYNFVGNNPIIFKDPDGQKIVIYYKDENGKNQSYEYGSALTVPNNRFVQESIASIQRGMLVSKENEQFINEFKSHPLELRVVEGKKTEFTGSRNGITDQEVSYTEILDQKLYNNEISSAEISFNSSQGMETYNYTLSKTGNAIIDAEFTGYHSPANGFWHEIDHFKQFFKNASQYYADKSMVNAFWKNKEEMRVITGSEREFSLYFGEGLSNSHVSRTTDYYTTIGSTSTTPCTTCDVEIHSGTEVNIIK